MYRKSFELKGKKALVTGASRGIGRAIALGLAEMGADIVINSRYKNDLKPVAKAIESMGRSAIAISADLGKQKESCKMVLGALDEFGRIDILVNNAAVNIKGNLQNLSEDVWDMTMDINLKRIYQFSQFIANKSMIPKRSGSIINISSVAGLRVAADRDPYCISKAGLIMMTKVMAEQLGKCNIRVNSIAPGFIRTRMNEEYLNNPEELTKRLTQVPLGRLGEPEEIVGAVIYLASEASSYVTGATIVVGGGIYMH